MILFDFSDTSLKVLKLSSQLLMGKAIVAAAKGELKEGLILNSEILDPGNLSSAVKDVLSKAVPKPITDQEAAFVLHDERTFTLRLPSPPATGSRLAREELEKRVAPLLLPVPFSSQVVDSLGRQFIAADQKMVSGYTGLLESLGLKARLAVPESSAFSFLFAPLIKESELILFLDIGAKTTDAVLLDQEGVVQTFTEPIELTRLRSGIEELIGFSKEKLGKEPQRVFLGGGGALATDAKKLAEEIGRPVSSAEEVFPSYPVPIKVDFGKVSKLSFLSLFGLALVSQQKDRLNFLP